jgi:hypothetical protein
VGGTLESLALAAERSQATGRWLAGALAATLALAACGGSSPDPAPASTAGGAGGAAGQRLRDAVAWLCAAQHDARSSVPKARAVFFDRSHDQLHELARLTEPQDRVVTARLLEAKNVVEQDFLYPKTWPRVEGDIGALGAAARAALTAVSISPPPSCPG